MDTATLQRLLGDAAKTIRQLSSEKEKLASQLATYKQKELAEEVVDLMDARGYSDPDVSHKRKVASVLSSGKDLQVTRDALRSASTDMSFARVASEVDLENSNSQERFNAYLRS